MHELLGVIAAEVDALGDENRVTMSVGPFPADEDGVYVVEPHEYFLKVPQHAHPDADQLRRTIALCVEHPGSESFAQTMRTVGSVGARVAITDEAALTLADLGLPTHRIRLGYSALWDVWGGSDTARSHDIAFLGTIDRRRSRNITLDIRAANSHSVMLALPPQEAITTARPGFFTGRDKFKLLADTKIIVNMHREYSRSFEWVRCLEAMCNGCVVVSEHSTDIHPLQPGIDLVLGSSQTLFSLSAVMLADQKRLADIRTNCYEKLRSQLTMRSAAVTLCELAADLVSGRALSSPTAPRRAARCLPIRPPYGVVYPWDGDGYRDETALLASELEKLPLRPDHAARAAATVRRDRSPESLDVIILRSPGWPDFGPALAALATQLEGVDSVIHLCVDRVAEPRVIPDGAVVHSAEPRAGAGGVRNLALQSSDAAKVLVLDSTDELLPRAVERLRTCLNESDADVAYGMVVTADGQISSAHPYERERLRQANYLASAALWQRASLTALGGWCEGAGWRGQEVRDLWWRLGTAAMCATLVPRPLVVQSAAAAVAHLPDVVSEKNRALARRLRVSARVHPADFSYQFVANHPQVDDPLECYLSDGRRSAERLREVLTDHSTLLESASFDLLEFASGYGWASRHLPRVLPQANVVASDIHPQAMTFVRNELSLPVALSCSDPKRFDLGMQFDVVSALSFFSHMPAQAWGAWLKSLFRHTRTGGLLIFTTHREISPHDHLTRAGLDLDGFWLDPLGEKGGVDGDQSGKTVTAKDFVLRQVRSCLGTEVHAFTERSWRKHQDLHAVRRP